MTELVPCTARHPTHSQQLGIMEVRSAEKLFFFLIARSDSPFWHEESGVCMLIIPLQLGYFGLWRHRLLKPRKPHETCHERGPVLAQRK